MINPFLKTPIGQHGKTIEIKHLRNSWSKYGSINIGTTKIDANWYCQICREEQPKGIEPYLFPITDREFLRICSKCEHKKVKNNIITYESLVIVCRKRHDGELFGEF